VVVPDKQLSLAIGKEGQNARLAAKLSGWRIDIKSASIAEEEKLTKAEPEEEAAIGEELPAEELVAPEEALIPEEEAEAEPEPVLETELAPPETILKPPVGVGAEAAAPKLRFAEDVLGPGPTKATSKSKKKKKKGTTERSADDGVRGRRQRRERETFDEEGEEY